MWSATRAPRSSPGSSADTRSPHPGWGSHPPPSETTISVLLVTFDTALCRLCVDLPSKAGADGTRSVDGLPIAASRRRGGRGSTSDDDRDGAAVRAPGGAGDVARALGAEEDDHGGDLVRFGVPTQRPPAR